MNQVMRRMGALAGLVAIGLAGNALADPAGASFGPPDPGAVRCELLAEMNERAPTGTERQAYNWAQGYFAGRSAAAALPTPRALPAGGEARSRTWQALLGLCAAKPAGTVRDAVAALWDRSG